MKNYSCNSLKQTLGAVQQGIVSMQALQTETTRAHQKYLEVQAEANKALVAMIQSVQRLSADSFHSRHQVKRTLLP